MKTLKPGQKGTCQLSTRFGRSVDRCGHRRLDVGTTGVGGHEMPGYGHQAGYEVPKYGYRFLDLGTARYEVPRSGYWFLDLGTESEVPRSGQVVPRCRNRGLGTTCLDLGTQGHDMPRCRHLEVRHA